MKFRYKNLIIRIILLFLIFIGTVAVTFMLSYQPDLENTEAVEQQNATLPIIETKVGSSYINVLYGYTEDMVDRYVRDTVTPLPDNRNLQLKIQAAEDPVESIYYEIRSLDTTQLVENTEVTEWSEKENGELYVTLPIQNLMEEDVEYQLQIRLKTKAHEEVVYYTRVLLSDSLQTEEMISFIQEFREKTMDISKASGMAAYLKETTDTSGSLGKVTLHSSYSQLLWNYLNPVQNGEAQIYLTDINKSIGTFRMESQVTFQDAQELQHICDVTEIFTVQVSNGYWYVLNYEREVYEHLTLDSVQEKQERICLGIVPEDSIHVMNSAEGRCQAFVLNGELWLNQASENGEGTLSRVFGFSNEEPDVRADHKEHDIKLVSVDDEGNASFILYGYMNSGSHEGEVGLTFYSYDAQDNSLEEIFYLPFDRSYAILKEEIGQLAYINKSELFYLMLNGKIYAIDFAGKEYMTIVEDVADDVLVISSDSSVIAWEENTSEIGASQIQVLYLEDGHQNVVKAEKDEVLHAVGFIDEDLVVGKIRKSDSEKYENYTKYPIYALDIVDSSGKTAASYEKENILITDTSLENGGIVLKRAKVSGSVLTATTDDALIENVNQTTAEAELLVSGKASEGHRQWYLKIASETAAPELNLVSKVSINDSSYLKISLSGVVEDGMFFAYSKGKLQGIYNTAAEAVNLVYDDIGYVTDSNGNYVMRRGYRGYIMLGISSSQEVSTKKERKYACMQVFAAYEGGSYAESFAEMEKDGLTDAQILQRGMNSTVYDLTGCSLSQIVYYYLGHKHPIYAMTTGGAVLITGVSGENIYFWNPETGNTTSMPLETADSIFAAAGNIFISCMES